MEYLMQCIHVARINFLMVLFFKWIHSQNTVCESGYCYEVQTQTADWLEAQRLCGLKGMSLADHVPLTLTGDKVWVLNNQKATDPNSIQSGHCMQIQLSTNAIISTQPCYQHNSYICRTAYPRECLLTGRGNEYMGTTSKTLKGLQCDYWTSIRRSQILTFPDKDVSGAQNYCRNVDNSTFPWCYWTQNGNEFFKYCSIPACAQLGTCFKQPFLHNNDVKCTSSSCYIFVNGSVHGGQNWLSADKCCKSIGGQLMAAGNMTSVLQLLKPDTQAWIGAANFGQNTKFDAIANSYTCPYVTSAGSSIQYEDCTYTNKYVCKKENLITTAYASAPTLSPSSDSSGDTRTQTPTPSQSTPTPKLGTSTGPENTGGAKQEPKGDSNIIIYALVGAVVLLVAVVVFVISLVCVRKKRAAKKSKETADEPPVFFHNDVYEGRDLANNRYTTHIPKSVYTASKNNIYAEAQDNTHRKPQSLYHAPKNNIYAEAQDNMHHKQNGSSGKDNDRYSSTQTEDHTYSSPYKQDRPSHYSTAADTTGYNKDVTAARQNSKNEMASHMDQDKVHTARLDPVSNPMYSVNSTSESTYSVLDKSLKRRNEAKVPPGVKNMQSVTEPVYAEAPTLPNRNY